MQLLSVNVGRPEAVVIDGERVLTAIQKQPVVGPVRVTLLNLDGDRQADLRVHGGPDKAVYAYPVEHYVFWAPALGNRDLPHGFFGENLTVTGMLETEVCIGDRYRIGTVLLEVSQPRTPCAKLAWRAGQQDFIQRFSAARRVGFYLRVVEEGELQAGAGIEQVAHDATSLPIDTVYRLRHGKTTAGEERLLERAAALEALTASWRDAIRRRLVKQASG